MEMLSNVVLGDLVGRYMSFLFAKFDRQAATVQEDMERLRHLLLRSATVVEEAERRHVANRDMLRQLKALRDETLRGYYVLDAVRYRALPGGRDRRKNDRAEASRCTFTLSKFNPAKRVRFAGGDQETTAAFVGSASTRELQQVARSLEAMLGGMKEFVVLLMSYPPLYRQPYSAHLFVDKVMFGRHMERERIIEFLLQIEPYGAGNLGVLPVVGPAFIGKSTLVENVCNDEKVRNHFSLILVYNENDLKVETMASLRDKCVIKHHNDKASQERLLVVVELLENVDEETWKKLYSSNKSMAQGIKMIITSRSEKVMRFGTTQALRLECLPTEAYWYFFKMLAFGSEDPEQHPKLASIALEMARQLQGSIIYAHIGAALLRANFTIQNWSMVLMKLREYFQKNMSLLGDEYPHDLKVKDRPQCTCSLTKQDPNEYFMIYDIYLRGSALDEAPKITMIDLLLGCAQAQPQGKYEILFWKSRIPPYFNYVCLCETVICKQQT